ncbi:MAG: hypothetical protein CMJ53_04325 [Planctomycetaceae bacterium]|nr:hypothetical protein [Planctomycetaceae bacterium]|tara:strand:- start:624 stop:1322 length:699 start_codon:yes stop_codon:yes gene_type:complete
MEMPFLRQILSDRAVTEVILLRAPRASTPFEYDSLDATVHESRDTLSALGTITILKQRQRPKNDYPRESRGQIALIYCKRSEVDDMPKQEHFLRHLRKFHPEIGIWCIPEDDLVIELNTRTTLDEGHDAAVAQNPEMPDDDEEKTDSAYGTLKFTGSFVQPHKAEEIVEEPPPSKPSEFDLKSSDEFEDPDSTNERTDSTVSSEELELLLRDSDEDHEDGTTDSEPSEDSGQ